MAGGNVRLQLLSCGQNMGKYRKGKKFVNEFRPLYGRISNLLVLFPKVSFWHFKCNQPYVHSFSDCKDIDDRVWLKILSQSCKKTVCVYTRLYYKWTKVFSSCKLHYGIVILLHFTSCDLKLIQ